MYTVLEVVVREVTPDNNKVPTAPIINPNNAVDSVSVRAFSFSSSSTNSSSLSLLSFPLFDYFTKVHF